MRLLLITPRLPHAQMGYGGGVFVWRMLEYLTQRHEVDLVCFQHPGEEGIVQELARRCQRVFTVPDSWNCSPMDRITRRLRAPHHYRPFVPYNYSAPMARMIAEAVRTTQYDILQAEHVWMGRYIVNLAHRAKILDEIDLQVLTYRQRCEVARLREKPYRYVQWKRVERYEQTIAEKVKIILVRTPHDQTYLQTLSPLSRVRVVPYGVATENLEIPRVDPGTPHLLFMGDFQHSPNADGILYFIEEIWSQIRRQCPGTVLSVVGRNPPAGLSGVEGVHVEGFVPSVMPFIAKATVLVSPIRWGSGIKTKNLEAMSLGLPIVTTTCGAEGISAVDGESIMIADRAEDFAEKVLVLLASPELRQRMGSAARELLRARYTWAAVFGELERVYRELLF